MPDIPPDADGSDGCRPPPPRDDGTHWWFAYAKHSAVDGTAPEVSEPHQPIQTAEAEPSKDSGTDATPTQKGSLKK